MSEDIAHSALVVFEGIAAVSQLCIAIATALVALVGYLAFIREEQTKRDALERQENREIIGKVVSSIEAFAAKVERSTPVGIEKVNYFPTELAEIEGAIGLARAHGLNELVDAANEYLRQIKLWRHLIVLEKAKRPDDQRQGKKYPPNYAIARDRTAAQAEDVRGAQDALFKAMNSVLGIEVTRSTSEIPVGHEDDDQ